MKQQTDCMNGIDRLVALAERCAAEGQMNLNKLLEAIIFIKTRQAGWGYYPLITTAGMLPELDASLQALKQEGIAIELISALESGRQALEEGRPGDLLIEEAPDVFVCRSCGHPSLGSLPDHCPECGAWPGRYRKFVAMFNGDNLEPTNPMEVLALLAYNAEELQKLVGGLSEEEMALRSMPGVWSIYEHISHFYDTQAMLDRRVELMLNYDDPELTALAVYELATQAEQHLASARAVLEEFRRKRSQCLARLESLPLKDLWRTGRHPEFGQITILRQAAYLAYHEQTHLPEIKVLRKQVVGKIK